MSDTQSPVLRRETIDDLDRAIVNLSARMDAACYQQLVLIREFDQRAGWLQWRFSNCAEWLAWRCDIGMGAAREKVRVAHALLTLPNISMAFAEGRLSYTKVRALTRVAHLCDENGLLSFAFRHTAVQVQERCRELRCGTVASTDETNTAQARRYLTLLRHPHRGTVTITVELPLEQGELIDKALDKARDSHTENHPEFADESWGAQQADALVEMARTYMLGDIEDTGNDSTTNSNYQVTVHVDRSALVEGRGRSGLPMESARRLSCDTETVTIVEDENEQPLSVGRKTRTVPTAIKRALWARDKGCRFPGCHRKRFVDAHHIKHWSQGGETGLENLMLLCTSHHRLVHEGGFSIQKDYQDQWCFKRPNGIAVPECGYSIEDTVDETIIPLENNFSKLIKNPSRMGFHTVGKDPSRRDWVSGMP